jgi:hypothetical protein
MNLKIKINIINQHRSASLVINQIINQHKYHHATESSKIFESFLVRAGQ